jgi:flavin reductase (DIM6/NTAB) family NADH-FMN oxidoreductase RutF
MSKVTLKPATEFTPSPLVLVTCGVGERANIIAIAWTGIVCSDPPAVAVAVRPSRHSHGLLKETPEFGVCFPPEAILPQADLCGTISGRDGDKFAATGLTREAGEKIQVPLIAECPLAVECRTRQVISLGSHDLFIGEIVAVRADAAILTPQGRIDYARIPGIAVAGGSYWAADRPLSPMGFARRAK